MKEQSEDKLVKEYFEGTNYYEYVVLRVPDKFIYQFDLPNGQKYNLETDGAYGVKFFVLPILKEEVGEVLQSMDGMGIYYDRFETPALAQEYCEKLGLNQN